MTLSIVASWSYPLILSLHTFKFSLGTYSTRLFLLLSQILVNKSLQDLVTQFQPIWID